MAEYDFLPSAFLFITWAIQSNSPAPTIAYTPKQEKTQNKTKQNQSQIIAAPQSRRKAKQQRKQNKWIFGLVYNIIIIKSKIFFFLPSRWLGLSLPSSLPFF